MARRSVLPTHHEVEHSGLIVLIDPGRTPAPVAELLAGQAADAGVVAILVGDSFGSSDGFGEVARAIRRGAPGVPILQLPANAAQLTPEVDAVLLLSLVSGRNPQYLIEEHVRAVPFFRANPHVGVLSTAYVLVDGGSVTSVESVSQTRPLPADKPELISAHVAAAGLIGISAVYLEAGSGARRGVAPALIAAARSSTSGPLFVGGGVRDAAGVRAAREAGADYVVVGTAFERAGANPVSELALAARV